MFLKMIIIILTVAADAVVPNNDYQSMNVGAEFSFMNICKIRGGYNSLILRRCRRWIIIWGWS